MSQALHKQEVGPVAAAAFAADDTLETMAPDRAGAAAAAVPLPTARAPADRLGAVPGAGARHQYVRAAWRMIQNGLMVADAAALFVAAVAAYAIRFETVLMTSRDLMFVGASLLMTLAVLQMHGAYAVSTLKNSSQHINALFLGLLSATAAVLACSFAVGYLKETSRLWLAIAFGLAVALVAVNHIVAGAVVHRQRARGLLRERIALLGVNDRARMILERINNTGGDVEVIGLYDDRLRRCPPALGRHCVRGTTEDLLANLRQQPIDRVIVTLPWQADDRIRQLLSKMSQTPVRIDLVPHDLIWGAKVPDMERIAGVPVFTVANSRIDEPMGFVKRCEDVILASLMLLALSPVMLGLALAIRLESPGPALFRQKRYGFNNQVFDIFKFRSMYTGPAPDSGSKQATRDDPRITRIGRFIRRTSLDELPQLLNVIKGDMSLVGPRPHAVPHNELYGRLIDQYFARHNVRPGITGWAQVNGLRGETDTDEKMRQRVEHDLQYIDRWSVLLDIKIILLTGLRIWFQKTAY